MPSALAIEVYFLSLLVSLDDNSGFKTTNFGQAMVEEGIFKIVWLESLEISFFKYNCGGPLNFRLWSSCNSLYAVIGNERGVSISPNPKSFDAVCHILSE